MQIYEDASKECLYTAACISTQKLYYFCTSLFFKGHAIQLVNKVFLNCGGVNISSRVKREYIKINKNRFMKKLHKRLLYRRLTYRKAKRLTYRNPAA